MLHLVTPDCSLWMRNKISDFFAQAGNACSRLLFTDYDGTLAPFCIDRDAALPYPGVKELLGKIQRCANSRLVIVSGRRTSDVDCLLGLENLEIWGCHGLEHQFSNGVYEVPQFTSSSLHQLDEAKKLLAQAGLSAQLEWKPGATAIHWRGMESAALKTENTVRRVWSQLRNHDELRLMKFDGGMEILVAGRTKGDVVRAVLAEIEEDASVAFLGDDRTDEDAFLALRGRGLSVLVREKYRSTAADAWIQPPEEVLEFLSQWAAACGGAS